MLHRANFEKCSDHGGVYQPPPAILASRNLRFGMVQGDSDVDLRVALIERISQGLGFVMGTQNVWLL